jgi:hypothetical protein
MDGTGSEQCKRVDCGTSGVEPLGFSTAKLVDFLIPSYIVISVT